MKLINLILHPARYISALYIIIIQRFGSSKKLAESLYRHSFGRDINWLSPEDLNQWINWLEFNTDTSKWQLYADKYRMRDYVIQKGFGENLVKLFKVWNSPEEMDFNELPEKFVLKLNNGSGDVIVVTDKYSVDIEGIRSYFKKLYSTPFGKQTAEPHYLHIQPVIVAEELLDKNKQRGDSSSLIDYKFWCFNGIIDCCFVCSNRSKKQLTIDLYTGDSNWERIENGNLNYDSHHIKASQSIPRPINLERMFHIASELSKGEPQMRVDFYEVDGKLYIGELTMTSACGRMRYFTDRALERLGNKCRKAIKDLGIK